MTSIFLVLFFKVSFLPPQVSHHNWEQDLCFRKGERPFAATISFSGKTHPVHSRGWRTCVFWPVLRWNRGTVCLCCPQENWLYFCLISCFRCKLLLIPGDEDGNDPYGCRVWMYSLCEESWSGTGSRLCDCQAATGWPKPSATGTVCLTNTIRKDMPMQRYSK